MSSDSAAPTSQSATSSPEVAEPSAVTAGLKEIGAQIKEAAKITASHLTQDESTRSLTKCTSLEPVLPDHKHMKRLVSLTQGYFKWGTITECNEWLVTNLEERLHSISWITAIKALLVTHHLLWHGSDEFRTILSARAEKVFDLAAIKSYSHDSDGKRQKPVIDCFATHCQTLARCLDVFSPKVMDNVAYVGCPKDSCNSSLNTCFKFSSAAVDALETVIAAHKLPLETINNAMTNEVFTRFISDGKLLYVVLTRFVDIGLVSCPDACSGTHKFMILFEEYDVINRQLIVFFKNLADTEIHFGDHGIPKLVPLPTDVMNIIRQKKSKSQGHVPTQSLADFLANSSSVSPATSATTTTQHNERDEDAGDKDFEGSGSSDASPLAKTCAPSESSSARPEGYVPRPGEEDALNDSVERLTQSQKSATGKKNSGLCVAPMSTLSLVKRLRVEQLRIEEPLFGPESDNFNYSGLTTPSGLPLRSPDRTDDDGPMTFSASSVLVDFQRPSQTNTNDEDEDDDTDTAQGDASVVDVVDVPTDQKSTPEAGNSNRSSINSTTRHRDPSSASSSAAHHVDTGTFLSLDRLGVVNQNAMCSQSKSGGGGSGTNEVLNSPLQQSGNQNNPPSTAASQSIVSESSVAVAPPPAALAARTDSGRSTPRLIPQQSTALAGASEVLEERFTIDYKSVLGKGAFGNVYKAFDSEAGFHVAVKEFSLAGGGSTSDGDDDDEDKDKDSLLNLKTEFDLLAKINHVNVVQVFALLVDKTRRKAQIFMEWVPGGSLLQLLKSVSPKGFKENVVVRYTRSLLEGVQAIHEANMLHRDIKPGNMLLTTQGDVKVTDFGTARVVQTINKNHVNTGTVVGTVLYLAPECLSRGAYSFASDVWGVGCSVLELLTGVAPWSDSGCNDHMSLLFRIGSAKPPNHHPTLPPIASASFSGPAPCKPAEPSAAPDDSFAQNSPLVPSVGSDFEQSSTALNLTPISPKAHDFLKQCFAYDPADRMTIPQLLEHPFLQPQ